MPQDRVFDSVQDLAMFLYVRPIARIKAGLRMDVHAPNTYPHILSDSFRVEIDDSIDQAILVYEVDNGRTVETVATVLEFE